MGNGIEEAHLPSSGWHLWEIVFLEISSITHRQDNLPVLQKTIDTVNIVRQGKKIPFFLPAEPHCILRECDNKRINHCDFWIDGHKIEHSFQMCEQKINW